MRQENTAPEEGIYNQRGEEEEDWEKKNVLHNLVVYHIFLM